MQSGSHRCQTLPFLVCPSRQCSTPTRCNLSQRRYCCHTRRSQGSVCLAYSPPTLPKRQPHLLRCWLGFARVSKFRRFPLPTKNRPCYRVRVVSGSSEYRGRLLRLPGSLSCLDRDWLWFLIRHG